MVMDEFRGRGIGRALIEAAERHFRDAGCRLVEVTSNDRLVDAHRFYEHAGYVRTSKRFAKKFAWPLLRRSMVAPTAESFSSSRS